MRNKGLVWFCAIMGLLVCLLGIFIVGSLILENFAVVNWHFYPRDAVKLDAREDDLSLENYAKLTQELPDCDIRWSVPFQGGRFDSLVPELTVDELSAEDLELMKYFPNLQRLNAENCRDYDQLAAFQEAYPDCRVLLRVTIDGTTYDQDAHTVTLKNLDAAQAKLLKCLPKLTAVNASGCREYDLLYQVQQEHPDCTVLYTLPICGEEYPSDSTELNVTGATAAELTTALQRMPHLQSLRVNQPQADAEELLVLRSSYPQVDIHWVVDVFGNLVGDDLTELNISGHPLSSVEQAAALAEMFPNLETIVLSDCGLSNETLAEFREAQRDQYKVVWTVYFSPKCKTRTDATFFMPIKQGEYYFGNNMDVMPLKYCEDMICVDVGDAPALKVADWAAYMPHLKYLILANSNVQDISALANCKELIYLELDGCEALRDLSPLVGCTSLQDLNLSRTYCKAEPLCEMTWLKNLWWENTSTSKQVMLTEALPETHLQFTPVSTASGLGWRCLPNYYAQRDILGMYYME